jgi:hypothetical protein
MKKAASIIAFACLAASAGGQVATAPATGAATGPASASASVPGSLPTTAPASAAATAPVVDPLSKQLHDEKIRTAMAKGADALIDLLKKHLANTDYKRLPQSYELDKAELAMGVYALLMIHQVTGDPRYKFDSREMAPLVDAVRAMRTHYTYCASFQALALSRLPGRAEFRRDLEAIRDQLWAGCMEGAYTYELPVVTWEQAPDKTMKPVVEAANRPNRMEPWDNSNGQYGFLGMWACSDAGLEVPDKYWMQIDNHWRGCQLPSGAWPYVLIDKKSYPNLLGVPTSMTAAGIANLIITSDKLDATVRDWPMRDRSVADGIAQLEKDMTGIKARMGTDLYLDYSIERAALATGMKRIGNIDWFKDGATAILQRQFRDGTWEYQKTKIVGTSYALLFLARGRAPIVFNKLKYSGPWDSRPRDAARVTTFLGHNTEQLLNWQVADLASQDDGTSWLDDAPILLITGRGDPKFTLAELKKFRQFVEAGGTIVSSADGGDETFTAVIKSTYAPAICGKKYEMRPLPENHFIYRMNAKITGGQFQGLSNGARELWIHSKEDMAGVWQANKSDASKGGGGAMWDMPVNIYSYVSGREPLRCRLDPLSLNPPGGARKIVTVGRIAFPGNDLPEPGAWQRYSKITTVRWGVDVQAVTLRPSEINVRIPVMYVCGTGTFSLAAPDKKVLAAYLKNGGTLIADPTGGDEAFIKSFQTVIAEILPKTNFEIAPTDHPVFTGQFEGGAAIKELKPRRFNAQPENGGRKFELQELKLEGRPAVLLFTGDISSGFLGTNTWGIFGYSPETSEMLMWNALGYLKGR